MHDVFDILPVGSNVFLPAFHALTGSDFTSFIANHTKTTMFNTFLEHHSLLTGLGAKKNLSPQLFASVERFLCHIYKVHIAKFKELDPLMLGWKMEDEKFVPVLKTQDAISDECFSLIHCQCKTGCINFRCKCRKKVKCAHQIVIVLSSVITRTRFHITHYSSIMCKVKMFH